MRIKEVFTNNNRYVWAVVLIFCLTNNFFNYKPIVLSSTFGNIINLLINLCFVVILFKYCFNRQQYGVSKDISRILVMFAFSIFIPFIFWNQSIYYTFRTMGMLFPLCFYFLFIKFKISSKQLAKSIVILAILYSIAELIGLSSYPNNIIGYSDYLTEDVGESSLEQRGIIRLSVPGADFIVFTIFLVLTKFKHQKKYYVFLIPLFVLLLMRGTRTPFLVTSIFTVLYIIHTIRKKILVSIICLIVFLSYQSIYNQILNSDSDNIVVKYAQLTENQMSSGEEDIRITMTKFFFTEFNNNPIKDIIGNGVPSVGKYGDQIAYLGKNRGLCITDVLPTNIFLYFGVVGLVLYSLLLIKVIRTKVSDDCLFSKLMVLYMFAIGPTNVALLSISPMIFAMGLYGIYIGSTKS